MIAIFQSSGVGCAWVIGLTRWLSMGLALLLAASQAAAVIRVAQLVEGEPLRRFYPGALNSLLVEINNNTSLQFANEPEFIESFNDPRLFDFPIIYVNFGDRRDWNLDDEEREQLRRYLERGGFLFIDAGITAEFLRGQASHAQSHSFPEWTPHPALVALFSDVLPTSTYRPLPRAHPVFSSFYSGLPDSSALPEAIRSYVINEKWPQGTYSFVGWEIDGRLAVITTPIIAMGWARDEVGRWVNQIGFRVREGEDALNERLQQASHSGTVFMVNREDGRQDRVFTPTSQSARLGRRT
ncbi:MAG: DUF4159 domain-containing protein [Verrucomicrobia bacterium]|nr:DUF4159 domain-containing protein [Verrucomicrobiota bacterium]